MKQSGTKRNKGAERELKGLYGPIRSEIEKRLREFEEVWNKGSEEDIFAELVFCLLTPQSKAKSCDFALTCLIDRDLVLKGGQKEIAKELRTRTRFHNNKAGYIVEARSLFTEKGSIAIKTRIDSFTHPREARDWLAFNVKGLGLKEASHFMRNVGMGEELAILDRHILKNLVSLGVIPKIPDSLTEKRYKEIEEEMRRFSKEIGIPLAHLDLLLWYKETGEVFK